MVNVIGLGYIGLPTALMLASHGVEVVGTDYNKELVATLNAGHTTFREEGLDELFQNCLLYTSSIGANATVVCGHTIGKWALIGAGAVVTSDVPSHALMLGVPAKKEGWVCECGNVLPGNLTCSKCGKKYRITDTGLEEA